jgi:AcrR family transcriptional regulator
VDRLVEAGLAVFGAKGFQRTQMADVARAMGVAPGTLYGYVEGKEALFHLVLDRVLPAAPDAPAPAPSPLPRPTPGPSATLDLLRARLDLDTALPHLRRAARTRPAAGGPEELGEIVRELYHLLARARGVILVIERSALEMPDLSRLFYHDKRRRLLARIEAYLASRMRAGRLRPVSPPAVAARILLENVAMFAMHRHRDPDPEPIDDGTVEKAVVDFVVGAFAPPHPTLSPERRGKKARRP